MRQQKSPLSGAFGLLDISQDKFTVEAEISMPVSAVRVVQASKPTPVVSRPPITVQKQLEANTVHDNNSFLTNLVAVIDKKVSSTLVMGAI